MLEVGTHGVNLSFDGVARHSTPGPAFGNHRAQPEVHDGKQGRSQRRRAVNRSQNHCVQRIAVQREMRGFSDDDSVQRGLKLRTRLKPLHKGRTLD